MKFKLILILLLVSSSSFAQLDFLKTKLSAGYLVTKSGDTLKGFIEDKSRFNLNEKIKFKYGNEEYATGYAIKDISKVVYSSGSNEIIVQTLEVRLEYQDPIEIKINLDDMSAVQTMPLRLLYKGDSVSLYAYKDIPSYYFIAYKNEFFQLNAEYRYLTDQEKRARIPSTTDPTPTFYIYDKWKVLLQSFYDFSRNKKLNNQLELAKFDEYSLLTIISRMDKAMSKK